MNPSVSPEPARKPRPPLGAEALERMALHYIGRFATSRAKLRTYLRRKIAERGWEGEGEPPIERLIERFASLGYVDDKAFAESKAAALGRRGYGARRVSEALKAAGIDEEDGAGARGAARDGAWAAALRFAERRRIGPYAREEADRPAREKALAAMLRAGHPLDLARRIVNSSPGDIPEQDAS
jgi:regulatory protein